MSNQTKEAIAKSPSGRVRRSKLGTRNVLTVEGKEAGYVYRIVNDDGDRVQRFQEIGYELVPAKDVKVGDKRVNTSTATGSQSEVSVGGGRKAYVMRIPQDWYNEDQITKLNEVDSKEAAMKQNALDGTYGTLDISRK